MSENDRQLDELAELFSDGKENTAETDQPKPDTTETAEQNEPAPAPEDIPLETEQKHVPEEPAPETAGEKTVLVHTVDKAKGGRKGLLIDTQGNEAPNYTGDAESERDYHPVRQSHEYRSGCLGGVMYFVFIACVSVVLAVFGWMAASDMLALNKDSFTASVTLPTTIFETVTENVTDDNGNITGTKEVTYADIDYVADTLKSAGLIEYKWLFEFFCNISHASQKIDAGTYDLKSTFDYRALVSNMQTNSNRSLTVTVTIPEGYSMHDIFLKLEEEGVCDYDDLMDAAANHVYNYPFLDENSIGDATRLEGYLFPDTYEFYVGMQASSAINKFLQNFNEKYTDEMQAQADTLGLTTAEVITIASLIEKEAAVDADAGVDERATVASVIFNRINAGMSLGLESAILYIYPDYEGSPTAEMMRTDSPYNLNLCTGLPPTPICSPSLAAINATLNPASTRYYYFTLDTETNTHRFFTNYNDFTAFVATQDYTEDGNAA